MQGFAPEQNSGGNFFPPSPFKVITYWDCHQLGSLVTQYFLPGSINLGIDFKISWYLRSTVVLAPGGAQGSAAV